jgi:hypothetical protein
MTSIALPISAGEAKESYEVTKVYIKGVGETPPPPQSTTFHQNSQHLCVRENKNTEKTTKLTTII